MFDATSQQAVEDFERAWHQLPRPCLEFWLHQESSELLCYELLLVDMEHRWRSCRGSLDDELGGQPRIEDYLRWLTQLQIALPVNLDWIGEEYRVRSIWGDRPSHSHYVDRFPGFASRLAATLRRIDQEIQVESISRFSPRPHEFDPRAPLDHRDFRLQRMIGAGAIGKVYHAHQHSLNRSVAIKALRKGICMDDWAIDVFLNEAQTLAQLDHPGIARVHGVGRFPSGSFFQALELVRDGNLRERIVAANGKITLQWTKAVMCQLAETLRYVHQCDLVHGDVKPENILFDDSRTVLCDFGLAQRAKSESNPLGGTPHYQAPEVKRDEKLTPAADVFALGMIWEELNRVSGDQADAEMVMMQRDCLATLAADRPTADDIVRHLAADSNS